MLSLLETNLPCVVPVVEASANQSQDETNAQFLCKPEWSTFISTLSSPSPVCALVHPSERVSSLISVMSSSDITKDLVHLKVLQEEIPVVFQLLRSLGYYPRDILAPLLSALSKIAFATFSSVSEERPDAIPKDDDNKADLACFPVLPQVRSRGIYQADKKPSGAICNKHRSKHPSLLPGIFTIFCQHG